jgi:hypothetical protein
MRVHWLIDADAVDRFRSIPGLRSCSLERDEIRVDQALGGGQRPLAGLQVGGQLLELLNQDP